MKKTIFILTFTIFLLSTLTSCGTTATITTTPGESSTPATVYPEGRNHHESDDYLIIGNDDFIYNLAKDSGAQVKFYKDVTFDFGTYPVLMTEESIAQNIESKERQYNGATLTYQGDTDYLSHEEELPGGIIDYYSAEGLRVGYIRNTNTVVSLTKTCNCEDTGFDKPHITRDVTNRYLTQLKGTGALDDYTVVTPGDFYAEQYDIIYSKLENGYPTGNFITMDVCACGEIVGHTENYDTLYKTATEELNQERVDYAVEIIKEKVSILDWEVKTCGKPSVRIDSEGEYYIALDIMYKYPNSQILQYKTVTVYYKY